MIDCVCGYLGVREDAGRVVAHLTPGGKVCLQRKKAPPRRIDVGKALREREALRAALRGAVAEGQVYADVTQPVAVGGERILLGELMARVADLEGSHDLARVLRRVVPT